MLLLDSKRYRMTLRSGLVPRELRPFETDGGRYSFPVCGDIVRRLTAADPGLALSEELLDELARIREEQERALEVAGSADCDGDERLFPYQRVGVRWLLEVGRGVLADEQGLGKTVMAIAAARETGAERALVICPGSVVPSWSEHIREWAPDMPAYEMPQSEGGRATTIHRWAETGGFLVTNYARAELEELSIYCELVIIDEAHKARNRKTSVSESVRRIAKRAENLFLLTASPTVNIVPDIWPLLSMCDPRRFGSFWGFVFRFCEVSGDGYGLKVGGVVDGEAESLDRILKPYVLRRHGLLGLTPSESRTVEHRLEGEQKKLYTDMGKTGVCTYRDATVEVIDVLAQVTRLRQLALDPGLLFGGYDGPSKLDALPDIVGERPGKVVVFTSFAQLAWRAAELLSDCGFLPGVITGEVSEKQREAVIADFKRGATRVLVVTHGTGGEGLNLEEADRAVFLDLAWHPAGNEHAMRRILRPGQRSDRTQITYLHSVGTIEDHVRDIVAEKRPVTISEILARGGVARPVSEVSK